MDIESTVSGFERKLAKLGTPERATQEQRYLKSQLTFLGVGLPVLRREAKVFAREHADLDRSALKALTQALWATQVHELRSLAIALLELRFNAVTEKRLATVRELLKTCACKK